MQVSLASVTSEELLRHVKVLASDQFEGRAPGTRGEDLFATSGLEAVGKPGGYALGKLLEYNKHYHKVSDEVRPDWDFSGVVEDAQLFFMIGYLVAQADRYPEWKPGSEFKRQPEARQNRARR